MTEETQVQENTETPEQEAQATTSDESVDYKALYLEEVGNAKKLRKRAQDAEGSISEYKTAQETDKVRQLKEQENYKELSESLQSKLDEVSPFKDKWEKFESNERERLLSKLPKEDRESLANEKLSTLKYIASKLEEPKPQATQHTANSVRNSEPMPENPFESMDKAGLHGKWNDIVREYSDRHNKKQ